LFPPDPGALRLLAALRATLAAVITFFLVVLLGLMVDLPIADRILGFAIALFTAANVRDATPRDRFITILIAPFAAFAAVAVATLLLDQPFIAAAIVPLAMSAIVYFGARGPRYASLGTVALIAYFIGLVTRQGPEALPLRFIVLLLAAGNVALIRCVLMPERPEVELARLRRAIHAAVNRILLQVTAAVGDGRWSDAARAALHRDIFRLGDCIMLAQARIATLGTQVPEQASQWLHLLTIELATERVARVALQGLGEATDRSELLAVLDTVRESRQVPAQRSKAPLGAALTLLGHVLTEAPPAVTVPTAAPPPPAGAPVLRSAIQAGIAAALAIISGVLVSSNRWYWAAFAAYVMFQGTRSRGESIAKGVQFMLGTVAGVLIGAVLATLLSGHDLLTLVIIIGAVFLAFQANLAAYGVMIFWITIILGLTFGMLGYFAPEFLLLRLKETLAGALCGVVVASFVLVRREYAVTHDAAVTFLRALVQSVDCSARVLLEHVPAPELSGYVLTAEQRFREFSAVAQSEQSSHPLSRNEALRRRVLLLEACEEWARELGRMCLQGIVLEDATRARTVRETVARIDASVAGLIAHLAEEAEVTEVREPGEELVVSAQDDPAQHAVRLLLRIDAVLVNLGRQ